MRWRQVVLFIAMMVVASVAAIAQSKTATDSPAVKVIPACEPGYESQIVQHKFTCVKTPGSLPEEKFSIDKFIAYNNQIIPLANRLVAHYQSAQTWEGVDSDHPDAIALRNKIAKEEIQFKSVIAEVHAYFDQIAFDAWLKKAAPEDRERVTKILVEANSAMRDIHDQGQRYHALGY